MHFAAYRRGKEAGRSDHRGFREKYSACFNFLTGVCIPYNFFCMPLQNRSLLTAAESKLAEARNQYDQMVENKQLELSKHLKEISQRNDQVLHITGYL